MVFIHKSAQVSKKSKIGANTRIWNQAQIREGVVIGKNCIIAKGVYIGSNCEIGSNVKIQNYACIYERVIIEDGVFIGPNVCFANDKYPRAINNDGTVKKDTDWEKGVTRVKKGASIGAGSIILPGLVIGEFAMIGAGAVVVEDVDRHVLITGNPGVLKGYVCICGRKISIKKPKVFLCKKCQSDLSK